MTLQSAFRAPRNVPRQPIGTFHAHQHSLGVVYPLSHESITLSHSILSSSVALTGVSVSNESLETLVPAAAMVSSSSGCGGSLEKMTAGRVKVDGYLYGDGNCMAEEPVRLMSCGNLKSGNGKVGRMNGRWARVGNDNWVDVSLILERVWSAMVLSLADAGNRAWKTCMLTDSALILGLVIGGASCG